MIDIWRETVSVRYGSVDRSDRLTLDSVFSFFQEAAISHAASLGVGRDAMASAGQGWILSRLSLFIERRPAYGETIQVNTWPRRWEKLFALRDYEIRDAADKPVIRGRGGWLVLDIEKRRPLRVQAIMDAMPANDGIDAFPAGPAGLSTREHLAKQKERAALYSDIDYYGHANNARYIQWIQDATDMDVLTSADQIRLDINYLSEVLPGETVELWAAPLQEPGETTADYPRSTGPGFAYEGRRPDSGQAVFRAELRTGREFLPENNGHR
ncbi:MAG: thioesterase [Treponema sp.]|nr:thioesterase [Treponema sp.]